MPADVLKALETDKKLQAEKTVWNNHWQLVHEFFLQRKADFTVYREAGAFLNSDIWTSVPAKAAETCASALLGLVWPDNNSFSLEPFGDLADDKEVEAWFKETVTENMRADFDDPEAGLALALDELALDYVVSGTPALHCEEGERSTYRFDAFNVQQFAIDEGADGFVDTFYKTQEYTLRQASRKWGADKLSKKSQDAIKRNDFMQKIKVLHVIEPREVVQGKGTGSANMPFASYYIEVDAQHLIKEGGYHELPMFAVRYSKRIGEKYGRSPAMRSLPDVMELNAIWEIVTMGLEKNFDPPLAVYDDGAFGGGTIDTSAGAINVINVSGKLGSNTPIQPVFTVGQLSDISPLIERLEQTVNDHFMIDRLLDLDNEKTMTAREAMIRASLRQKALRSVVSRLLTELFNRMIERCFNIGLRKGRFGYVAGSPEAIAWQSANPNKDMKTIPEKVAQAQGSGDRVYKIRYMTPASREAEAEAAQGIMNWYEWMGAVSAYDRSVLDIPNNGRTARKLGDIWSVPQDCYNTEDELKTLQAGAVEADQKAGQLAEAEQVAAIAKDAAAAQNTSHATSRQL